MPAARQLENSGRKVGRARWQTRGPRSERVTDQNCSNTNVQNPRDSPRWRAQKYLVIRNLPETSDDVLLHTCKCVSASHPCDPCLPQSYPRELAARTTSAYRCFCADRLGLMWNGTHAESRIVGGHRRRTSTSLIVPLSVLCQPCTSSSSNKVNFGPAREGPLGPVGPVGARHRTLVEQRRSAPPSWPSCIPPRLHRFRLAFRTRRARYGPDEGQTGPYLRTLPVSNGRMHASWMRLQSLYAVTLDSSDSPPQGLSSSGKSLARFNNVPNIFRNPLTSSLALPRQRRWQAGLD